MRKWFLFIGITALLLTPWPVAYAHENVAATQGPPLDLDRLKGFLKKNR